MFASVVKYSVRTWRDKRGGASAPTNGKSLPRDSYPRIRRGTLIYLCPTSGGFMPQYLSLGLKDDERREGVGPRLLGDDDGRMFIRRIDPSNRGLKSPIGPEQINYSENGFPRGTPLPLLGSRLNDAPIPKETFLSLPRFRLSGHLQ